MSGGNGDDGARLAEVESILRACELQLAAGDGIGPHVGRRLVAELRRLEAEAADWERAYREMQRAANGLYDTICARLAPHFPKNTRDLEWDVLPGTLAGIAAEWDRLAKALPRTADGVPIVPGMFLYHGNTYAVAIGHVGQKAPIDLYDGSTACVGDCYSTRDAALAASAGAEAKNEGSSHV